MYCILQSVTSTQSALLANKLGIGQLELLSFPISGPYSRHFYQLYTNTGREKPRSPWLATAIEVVGGSRTEPEEASPSIVLLRTSSLSSGATQSD